MNSLTAFFRQALWLSVCIVPIPAGAFGVQTAGALMVGLAAFTVLGTLVPFFYFAVSRSGYGARWGKKRCAAHLESALSVCAILWLAFWLLPLAGVSLSTGMGIVASSVVGAVGLFAVMLLILAMDYAALMMYDRLERRSEAVRQWMALTFLIGWIPGTFAMAILLFALANVGNTLFFLVFMSGGMTWLLFFKIVLGLACFVFYLYFSLEGPRMQRMIQIVFTAVLWFFLIYTPLVISVQLPGAESWRVWADPAYLSVLPLLSELWSVGLACAGGRKITAWIYAAADA